MIGQNANIAKFNNVKINTTKIQEQRGVGEINVSGPCSGNILCTMTKCKRQTDKGESVKA